MSKTTITFLLLICIISPSYAQFEFSEKSVLLEKNKFYINTSPATAQEVLNLMSSSPEAFKLMKKAKDSRDLSTGIGYIGGFLVGYPIGVALAGGEANWTMAAIGSVSVLLSLEILKSFEKNATMAIDIYNQEGKKGGIPTASIRLGFLNDGIGLKLVF